ncbi:snoRNA binding protein [Ephemerocybe angulata]|uniref:SnoRNA binding protein n=1 Tax=Ephemerocybe angulata TaxID=980116 RepID=A0A8H6HSL0_9AGAR|nr:snoRNA binding protein [Tulosesus angulatus]
MTKDLTHLPTHSSAIDEKLDRQHKLRRKRGPLFISLACVAVFLTVLLVTRSTGRSQTSSTWDPEWQPAVVGSAPTLIFRRQQLQDIWKWEIASGHYPSRMSIPWQVGLKEAPINPAVPNRPLTYKPKQYQSPESDGVYVDTHGTGAKRVYLDLQSHPPDVAYPPRPVPGSVADMDEILKHCNFDTHQYVRDCLEVLRVGGGLDNGQRYRRENLDDWKYIYMEQPLNATEKAAIPSPPPPFASSVRPGQKPLSVDPDEGLVKRVGADWEPPLTFPTPPEHRPSATLDNPCDPDNPRIFHMFWTGPFTDKPYIALLSFLYTQNTGSASQGMACRFESPVAPSSGSGSTLAQLPRPTTPQAVQDMFDVLKKNPWSAPFLHPRFKDVIQFKPWNTTEQLDSIPEIKNEWRALQDTLFNSGGFVMDVKPKESDGTVTVIPPEEDDAINRAGSQTMETYDRLSVILSDMARFVLCHRFGGIYLDADTIFLRDWEELWGWKGAFAYRCALGSMLFRTALKNGLDFHPMTVTRYTADAHAQNLLLRLPDALFDSAWLSTEDFQIDRPPQPYFTKFQDFFDTPNLTSGSPQALGFKGFFRGAYSYHFHNFWWKPFDPARNFPDLGPKFESTEKIAHEKLRKAQASSAAAAAATTGAAETSSESPSNAEEPEWRTTPGNDKRDLDWSTVLKRTFESYIRGDTPNAYGEWLDWLE